MHEIIKLLHSARYVDSVHRHAQLPPDAGVEVAVAGRSNCGKSSLINRLCRQKSLARTSRTPGRTQQLVLFRLDDQRRLVDLPGYGYARVGADLRQHWQGLIQGYLESRRALAGLVLVMDIRHPLKDMDRQLAEFALSRDLPLHAVLTKADKLGHGKRQEALRAVQRALGPAVGAQTFSSVSGLGLEPLEQRLAQWFEIDPPQ